MSKLSKLINSPKAFFVDFYRNRFTNSAMEEMTINANANDNIAIAFHINDWKRPFLIDFFNEKKLLFVPFNAHKSKSITQKWKNLISKNPTAEFIIWGMNLPSFAASFENPRIYIEDGFIRSVGLGATHCPPFSLTIDRQTPYFNANQASDLECLLNSYSFAFNSDLIERSRKVMSQIISSGISKYNNSPTVDVNSVYGAKETKRILVLGQVEDDASIKFGCMKHYTNNDLVMVARLENPTAEIYYKPHPDVLARKRRELSDPNAVSHICKILNGNIALCDAFKTIDHVYTISSQAGFEALIRGIKVTTVGAPFYSGWGLTDDRQPMPRRNRVLTIEQLFAGAYLLYPTYYHPYQKRIINAEEAIQQIILMRNWELNKLPEIDNIEGAVKSEIIFNQYVNEGNLTLTKAVKNVVESVNLLEKLTH